MRTQPMLTTDVFKNAFQPNFDAGAITPTTTFSAQCEELDPTWKNVVTVPVLPVQHETEITLSCLDEYSNTGGDKARCYYGKLVLPDSSSPPLCKGL